MPGGIGGDRLFHEDVLACWTASSKCMRAEAGRRGEDHHVEPESIAFL